MPKFTMRLDVPKEEIAFAIHKHFNDYEGNINQYMNQVVNEFDWESQIKDQVDLTIQKSIREVFGEMRLGLKMKDHLRVILTRKLDEAFQLEERKNNDNT